MTQNISAPQNKNDTQNNSETQNNSNTRNNGETQNYSETQTMTRHKTIGRHKQWRDARINSIKTTRGSQEPVIAHLVFNCPLLFSISQNELKF